MSVEYALSPNSRTGAEDKQVLLALLLMPFLKKAVTGSFSEDRWKEMSVAVVTLEYQFINDAFLILISIGPVL